jgi:hypothetical protein
MSIVEVCDFGGSVSYAYIVIRRYEIKIIVLFGKKKARLLN